MFDLFELYLHEDCPYEDDTVELLKIQGEGALRIITRADGISACTEDLAGLYKKKGIDVLRFVESGERFRAGDVIFEVKGEVKTLFKSWRVSQTFLSITCAIATETNKLASLAKSVNPNVMIATTRKAHPGMRRFELKAVIAGGGRVHRNSLSDSVLITPNHLRFVDELRDLKSTRKIEIEPRNEEEAFRFAKVADVLLLDHHTPQKLAKIVPKLKALNPRVEIAVAGNVGECNIQDFARFADTIITSAPYYANPLDSTTRIEPAPPTLLRGQQR